MSRLVQCVVIFFFIPFDYMLIDPMNRILLIMNLRAWELECAQFNIFFSTFSFGIAFCFIAKCFHVEIFLFQICFYLPNIHFFLYSKIKRNVHLICIIRRFSITNKSNSQKFKWLISLIRFGRNWESVEYNFIESHRCLFACAKKINASRQNEKKSSINWFFLSLNTRLGSALH